MAMDKKMLLMLLGVVLISGCIVQIEKHEITVSEKDKAILECKQECESMLVRSDVDLNKGPCLLNPITDLPDWVCDIAHKPRQDVDNNPTNQCSAFREKIANHFVEVDANCELIQVL